MTGNWKFWAPRPALKDEQKFRRAEHAKRLLADDTLIEALDAMAEDAFRALMALPNTDDADRERVLAVDRLRTVEDFRAQLKTYVTVGTGAK